jgi:single-stranded-DNA-specific exonuclease
MLRQKWHITAPTPPGSLEEVLEILLANRNAGDSFLGQTLKDLEVHMAILGMDEGAELMVRHIRAGSKIVLVGDYDCDGVTSTAQMSLFLKDIGYGNFTVLIPSRSEGYGMPERAVGMHSDARLFVAMDCGTLDYGAIAKARALGADCIVIDHHEVPKEGVAPATVLINPKQPGCPSQFKEFCSSGLTLLFLARLRRALQSSGFTLPNLGGKYLALAAMGTVADMVPLVGGNRILARCGLGSINKRLYAPLRELIEGSGLSGRCITAGHIAFYLGPRINAAGRMAEAHLALDLLASENPEEIRNLVQELNRLNARRQSQEELILADIRQRVAASGPVGRTMVMGDPTWPRGIIGIVASKVQQELCYGPTIIFSIDREKGVATGSARSVPGYDIHAALDRCNDLILKWGGHKMAAGLTVALDRMEVFETRFEEVAQDHPAELFVPRGRVDMELDLGLVSGKLLELLSRLEPHGLGNPTPTFAVRQAKVAVLKAFGRDQNHLRILVDDRVEGIFWNGVRILPSRQCNGTCDVVFQLEWDSYSRKPILNIKDIGGFFP